MSIMTRNDYKPKKNIQLGSRRSCFQKEVNVNKVRQLVRWDIFSEFVHTFRALEEEVDELPEYLDALRRVLKKPLPKQEEVERLVPSRLEVRERYEELMEKLDGDIPEDKESRRVFAKVAAGPEYNDFRRKAEETLEKIDLFERVQKESKAYGDSLILPGARLILRCSKIEQ